MTQNRYLITGAAGFIGSAWVEAHSQDQLISVDHQKHFETRHQGRGLQWGKICDVESFLQDLLSSQNQNQVPQSIDGIDAIVHLGAITDTRVTDKDLVRKYNLEYSQALWNLAVSRKIPFVYASSAATYGDGQLGYQDDESRIPQLKPLNLYGQSKQDFDLWALDQERQGRTPPAWAGFKFFNVYGFGESHKSFMSSVVLHSFRQIQDKGFVQLFKSHREGIADGYQKRDFIDVRDVVRVLDFAIKKPIRRGIFNLGTGQARPFLDLAKAVFKSLGKPEKIEFIDTPVSVRSQYQYFTQATMERLRKEGYSQPFATLEQGVDHYIKRLTLGSNRS